MCGVVISRLFCNRNFDHPVAYSYHKIHDIIMCTYHDLHSFTGPSFIIINKYRTFIFYERALTKIVVKYISWNPYIL